MLRAESISHAYDRGTAGGRLVLDRVSFSVEPGDFVGVVGRSGAGKTTLVKHMNGLLRPTSGRLLLDGQDVHARGFAISRLRREVGLAFQYPEQQLFGRTVWDDVLFGPRQMGIADEDARHEAERALDLVGIGPELWRRSPLELSGGQRRCVAVAGVLAMGPRVFVLDEPAAGLDPGTRRRMFGLLARIREERGVAVVFVSHEMDDVAAYAQRVWVLDQGRIAYDGSRDIFRDADRLRGWGIDLPMVTALFDRLRREGVPMGQLPITTEEARRELDRTFAGRRRGC